MRKLTNRAYISMLMSIVPWGLLPDDTLGPIGLAIQYIGLTLMIIFASTGRWWKKN